MEGKGIEKRKERERDLYYGASEREGENRIESKVGERVVGGMVSWSRMHLQRASREMYEEKEKVEKKGKRKQKKVEK